MKGLDMSIDANGASQNNAAQFLKQQFDIFKEQNPQLDFLNVDDNYFMNLTEEFLQSEEFKNAKAEDAVSLFGKTMADKMLDNTDGNYNALLEVTDLFAQVISEADGQEGLSSEDFSSDYDYTAGLESKLNNTQDTSSQQYNLRYKEDGHGTDLYHDVAKLLRQGLTSADAQMQLVYAKYFNCLDEEGNIDSEKFSQYLSQIAQLNDSISATSPESILSTLVNMTIKGNGIINIPAETQEQQTTDTKQAMKDAEASYREAVKSGDADAIAKAETALSESITALLDTKGNPKITVNEDGTYTFTYDDGTTVKAKVNEKGELIADPLTYSDLDQETLDAISSQQKVEELAANTEYVPQTTLSEEQTAQKAQQLYESMSGLGTDERALYEILYDTSITPDDWTNIFTSFEVMYPNNSLINMIDGDFSGKDKNEIMTTLAEKLTQSAENGNTNATIVLCSELNKAMAGKLGTADEFVNAVILSKASNSVLSDIMDAYPDVTGSEIYLDIENDFSGSAEDNLKLKLSGAYAAERGEGYTGWDDGKISGQEKAKGVLNGVKDNWFGIATIAGGTIGAHLLAGTSAATAIGGIVAAAPILPWVLAISAVGVGGYMIYNGIKKISSAKQQAKNSTSDNVTKDAWRQGTGGAIETTEGAFIAYQGVKGVYDLTKSTLKAPSANKGGNTSAAPESESLVKAESGNTESLVEVKTGNVVSGEVEPLFDASKFTTEGGFLTQANAQQLSIEINSAYEQGLITADEGYKILDIAHKFLLDGKFYDPKLAVEAAAKQIMSMR